MAKEFLDSSGTRGNPKLTYINVRGKSLRFEVGEYNIIRISIPGTKNIPDRKIGISNKNARKLAYWLLDKLQLQGE